MFSMHSRMLESYVAWASKGRERLIAGRVESEIIAAFKPLLQGELEVRRSLIYYRDWRGAVLPVKLASALVEETAGILYAVASAPQGAMLLVEEPEAQLHPSAQIAAALLLAALAAKGYRVVATTHSDIIAVTLAYIAVLKPEPEHIEKLLGSIGLGEEGSVLARLAGRAAKTLRLSINYFTVEGRVERYDARGLLAKVPGITETLDALAAWAASLPEPAGGASGDTSGD